MINADPNVSKITLTNSGTPTLTLTAAQALNDTSALAKISNAPYGIAVVDTASDIETLSPAQIAALGRAGARSITATGGSVILSIVTAVAYEQAGYAIAVPAGDAVTVADAAAMIASTTQAQANALKAAGYTGIASTNGVVMLSLAEIADPRGRRPEGDGRTRDRFGHGGRDAGSDAGTGDGAGGREDRDRGARYVGASRGPDGGANRRPVCVAPCGADRGERCKRGAQCRAGGRVGRGPYRGSRTARLSRHAVRHGGASRDLDGGTTPGSRPSALPALCRPMRR